MEAATTVNWNDDRIDRFTEQVDRRFDKVDERFDKVDERFDKVDERFEEVDARFEKRFDFLTHAMIVTLASFLAAFIGLFASTQL
jgi:DNA anti-recombination protein RmuC